MEKTICPACNTEIEGSVKFCTECGANIEELKKAQQRRTCPKCGAEAAADTKFCSECGLNLEEAAKSQSSRKCVNCGEELEENVVFCPECGKGQQHGNEQMFGAYGFQPGSSQQGAQQQSRNEISQTEITTESDELLMRAYITSSTDPYATRHHYENYKKAFTRCEKNNSKVGWNWGAFWFWGWNLMYRKSYLWGIVIGLLASGVGGFIIPSMFADAIHYSRYHKQLISAKSIYPNDIQAQVSYMAKNGGVNKAIPIICIIISIIAAIIGIAAASLGL